MSLNECHDRHHAKLQNGVTYYYSASSYDGHGNYQSTMHATATPSFSGGDFSGSIGGGCGMVFPTDGRPSGPGQAADMTGLLTTMLLLWMRRIIRNLKSQPFYHLNPAGISDFLRWAGQNILIDICRTLFYYGQMRNRFVL
jgi:hypothetical protein